MSELFMRLEHLFLKLDHTALIVEQMIADALFTVENGRDEDVENLIEFDVNVDMREVETERECIRLLALYQPTAIDLRRISFVVKANSDLERIGDYSVKIAKRGRKTKQECIAIKSFPAFFKLAEQVTATYRKTIRLFTLHGNNESVDIECGMELARSIITIDVETNVLFREFLDQTLAVEEMFYGRLAVWHDLTALGRALRQIGDLCMHIAEDAIFMFSGEIVRHDLLNTSVASSESHQVGTK